MQIINSNPPNYENINAAFGPLPDTVLFCYGDIIYNPSGTFIPPEKIAHEEVHRAQQLEVGVEWWWYMYIQDKEFRLQEEVPAHQVDYKTYCKQVKDRNMRNDYLQWLAGELASSMYGNIISKAHAAYLIKHG